MLKPKIQHQEILDADQIQVLEPEDTSALRKKLVRWVSKGGLAILDQGLISGSNFVISVLLARWLLPEQYGAYAVAFGINVLIFTIYQSLLLEPMSVFGGSSYRNCLRGYLGSLLRMHVVVSLVIFITFGAGALLTKLVSRSTILPGALLGMTIASPFILIFALARRSIYLQSAPSRAAIGSLVYSTSILGALYLLFRAGLLSPMSAFLLMGFGAGATGLLQWIYLRRNLRSSTPAAPTLGETWGRHWRYGSWALAGSFAGWIPAYIYYPLLSSFGGMAHSGQLRALMNLTLPIEQMKAALGLLLIPYAARIYDTEGRSSARALSIKLTLVVFGFAASYWALLLWQQRPLFHFLYSGRYMDVIHLLPVVAIGSIVWTAAWGPVITLRGMNSPQSYFLAYAAATCVSLVVGIPATWKFGLTGAIWGSNVADICSFLFIVIILQRKIAGRSGMAERFSSWRQARASALVGESAVD